MPLSQDLLAIREKFGGRRGSPVATITEPDAPAPRPTVARDDEERAARAQVQAARRAYDVANAAVSAAWEHYRDELAAVSPTGRNADAHATRIALAERAARAAELRREAAEADLAEAGRALKPATERRKVRAWGEAQADIAERDVRLKAQRRARGLPPLPEPERFVVRNWRG